MPVPWEAGPPSPQRNLVPEIPTPLDGTWYQRYFYPPVDRMAHICENISFLQLLLRLLIIHDRWLPDILVIIIIFSDISGHDELTCFTLATMTHVNIGCPAGSRILVTSAIYGASPFGLCYGTGKDCTQEVRYYSGLKPLTVLCTCVQLWPVQYIEFFEKPHHATKFNNNVLLENYMSVIIGPGQPEGGESWSQPLFLNLRGDNHSTNSCTGSAYSN